MARLSVIIAAGQAQRAAKAAALDIRAMGTAASAADKSIRGLDEGLKKTSKATARTGRGIRRLGVGMSATRKAAQSLSSALAQMFGAFQALRIVKDTINTMRLYGETMQFVRAVTIDATVSLQQQNAEFKALNDTARLIGGTTRFSATQASEALLTLGRAGLSTTEAIQAIRPVLDLATTGALSFKDAANLTAVTIRQFNLSAEEATQVADVLVKASISAATEVKDLGEAMKFGAILGSQLGISMEETAASLITFATAGLKGSIAGTSLRQIIRTLEKPTDQVRRAIDDLGLSMADVDLETVGLIGAFKNLVAAGADMNDFQQIFTARAVTGVVVLAKNIKKLEEFEIALKGAGGEAKRTADIINDSLNGDVLQFTASLESVQLSMTGFRNGLREIVQFITEVVRAFDDIDNSLQGVSEAAEATAKTITILVSALSALIALRLVRFLIVTIFNFKRLFLLIAANPIGALVTLLGAAVGALIAFKDEAGLSGLTFESAFKLIGIQIQITLAEIENFTKTATGFFDTLFERIGNIFSTDPTKRAAPVTLIDTKALEQERREIVRIITGRNREIIDNNDDLFDAQLRFGRALEEAGIRVSRFFDEATQSAKQPELFEAFDRIVFALSDQASALRLTGAERENFVNSLQAEQDLIEAATPRMKELNAEIKLQGEILENVRVKRERLLATIVAEEELRGPSAVAELEAEFAILTAELELAGEVLADLQRIRELGIANIRQAIEQTVDAIERLQELKDLEALAKDIGDAFASNLGSMLEGFARVTSESANAREAFKAMGEVAVDALESIIRAIIKLVIQQALIKPLAGAITAGIVGTSAEGNVFQGGRMMKGFASGGVVQSPVVFPLQNGGVGLAGEAGPEGILPLKRGKDGKLGVIATESGGGGTIINQVFNITTPDAESFRRSRPQIERTFRRRT